MGGEPGPQAFKAFYEKALHTVSADFTFLEARITGFASALQECVTALETTEHDIESAQAALQKELLSTQDRPSLDTAPPSADRYSSGADVGPLTPSEG